MAEPKTARVLVADDFKLVRKMIADILHHLGYESIAEAKDGEEALNLIHTAVKDGAPYDLVFLDWNMPKASGLEILEQCRQADMLERTTMIMVTAESEQSNVIRALRAGAFDYIIKPVTREMVASKLERYWKLKREVA